MITFPYPQTAGKERNITTVDQSTFVGLPFRPTQTQAESLFRSDVYKANDWYETPYALQYSQQANVEESRAKAAAIGGEAGGGWFAGITDIFGKLKDETFRTIADDFMEKYYLQEQSRTIGSSVPGNPPAPGEINYTAADFERLVKERIAAGKVVIGSLVSQVKGLFNMGYPSPSETKSGETTIRPPDLLQTQEGAKLIKSGIIIFILYMVIR